MCVMCFRVNVASLLMVIYQDNLEYATEYVQHRHRNPDAIF